MQPSKLGKKVTQLLIAEENIFYMDNFPSYEMKQFYCFTSRRGKMKIKPGGENYVCNFFSLSLPWGKGAQKGPKMDFLDFCAKLNH